MPLTDSQVRVLPPGTQRQKKRCSDSLYAVVEPLSKGGGKSFIGITRFPPRSPNNGGTWIEVRIGPYGKGTGRWSLREAKEEWSAPEELVKLVVGVMGNAAEMEFKSLQKSTAEGRAVTKSRGVQFGRKKTDVEHQETEVLKKRSEGEGDGTIARSLGMSRSMVQRIIQQQKETE